MVAALGRRALVSGCLLVALVIAQHCVRSESQSLMVFVEQPAETVHAVRSSFAPPRRVQASAVETLAVEQHPHPITYEHALRFRDADLLHAAELAIARGEYDHAHALLTTHHEELGGFSTVDEEGLWLLADCAEEPTAENVASVQRFYDEHSDSMLRRTLRRACLELKP